MMAGDTLLVKTLVQLADNLVEDFDVVDLLSLLADRCVEILDLGAAGVMLASPEGDLRVVASSSEAMRVVQLFEVQADQGPCLDCYRARSAISNVELASSGVRWPRFVPVALDAGFEVVHALPMRLRDTVIGAQNLFGRQRLDDGELAAAQALADIATIAILQQRVVDEARLVNDQLNLALTTRVVIEQAKGVLAERAGLSVDAAFDTMRRYARYNNLRLADVARRVVDRSLPPGAMTTPPRRPS
ncbi:MAG: ANTAR domain-containing protein [Actinomycetota bacterium]